MLLADGCCCHARLTDAAVVGTQEMITNMAAKRSTAWVDTRCNEITGTGGAKAKGGKKKAVLRRAAMLVGLVAAWQLAEPLRTAVL